MQNCVLPAFFFTKTFELLHVLLLSWVTSMGSISSTNFCSYSLRAEGYQRTHCFMASWCLVLIWCWTMLVFAGGKQVSTHTQSSQRYWSLWCSATCCIISSMSLTPALLASQFFVFSFTLVTPHARTAQSPKGPSPGSSIAGPDAAESRILTST